MSLNLKISLNIQNPLNLKSDHHFSNHIRKPSVKYIKVICWR